jgi:hypothetical protein
MAMCNGKLDLEGKNIRGLSMRLIFYNNGQKHNMFF